MCGGGLGVYLERELWTFWVRFPDLAQLIVFICRTLRQLFILSSLNHLKTLCNWSWWSYRAILKTTKHYERLLLFCSSSRVGAFLQHRLQWLPTASLETEETGTSNADWVEVPWDIPYDAASAESQMAVTTSAANRSFIQSGAGLVSSWLGFAFGQSSYKWCPFLECTYLWKIVFPSKRVSVLFF